MEKSLHIFGQLLVELEAVYLHNGELGGIALEVLIGQHVGQLDAARRLVEICRKRALLRRRNHGVLSFDSPEEALERYNAQKMTMDESIALVRGNKLKVLTTLASTSHSVSWAI